METFKKGSFIEDRVKKTSERALTDQELIEYGIDNIPFPKNALVELTSNCNHACVFCTNPRMMRKAGKLDLGFFEKFIKDAVELGLEEVGFYTTGEPLMSKNLIDFIDIAKSNSIKYIYITTNGALAKLSVMKELINAGLNSVKFSINAGSKETYELIHGRNDFDKVLNNLKDLRNFIDSENKNVKLLSSFVVTRQSMHEIDKYKNTIGALVDDYIILGVKGQSGQSLRQLKELNCELTPEYPQLGQANPCSMLWNRVHLTQEGLLTLCCVDYENDLVYADLKKISLKKAWNNAIITQMRKRHVAQDLKGTLCHNCLYGKEEHYSSIMKINKTNRDEKRYTRGNIDVAERIKKLNLKIKKGKDNV